MIMGHVAATQLCVCLRLDIRVARITVTVLFWVAAVVGSYCREINNHEV
jgi:predicted membrane channel-forming protein YqfA (hemolysin III family)